MTTKIIIAALTATFGDKAPQIAELCNRAPNPQFEIETLLGVYEKPKLPRVVKMRDGDATLLNIDGAKTSSDVVSYSISGEHRRFFKDEEHAKRYPGSRNSGESSNYNGNYPLELIVQWVDKSSCSIESWLGYPVVEPFEDEEERF